MIREICIRVLLGMATVAVMGALLVYSWWKLLTDKDEPRDE